MSYLLSFVLLYEIENENQAMSLYFTHLFLTMKRMPQLIIFILTLTTFFVCVNYLF